MAIILNIERFKVPPKTRKGKHIVIRSHSQYNKVRKIN